MRLFTAVTPPAAALDALDAAVASARPTARGLRWVAREQWHMTLVFLGDVPDDQVDTVAGELGRVAARHPAMSLSLRGSGTFPPNRSAPGYCGRVWTGTRRPSPHSQPTCARPLSPWASPWRTAATCPT